MAAGVKSAAGPPAEGSRVAVVVFREHVATCSDVLNSARAWARHGWRVDVLAYDTGQYPRPELDDAAIRFLLPRTLYGRVRSLSARLGLRPPADPGAGPGGPEPGVAPEAALRRAARGLARGASRVLRSLEKLEFLLAHAWRLTRGGYRCVFACDTVSLVAARTANLLRGVPYVYHSRELVLSWDGTGAAARLAKWAERHCHRRALFTVAQDRARADLLGRDNGVPPESFSILPNSPVGLWSRGASDLLHRRAGLPAGTAIVLYAGGVTPEAMVLEIIESISSWPPGPVLVINGPVQTAYLPLLRAAAAKFPGRVRLLTTLASPSDVDDLYAGATVGVAFYRPIDDNFRYVGHAAGKIFNLMKVGVPVVTNDLPGMRRLVEESGCGLVVADPGGLGDALRRILADPDSWRAGCRKTFPAFEFSGRYAGVIARVEAATRYTMTGPRSANAKPLVRMQGDRGAPPLEGGGSRAVMPSRAAIVEEAG